MARYTGKSVLSTTYNVTDYHPLDTRQLVPTFTDLTTASNWETTTSSGKVKSIAFNGMIVAVGNDSEHRGVYYLFDSTKPGEKDVPDVAKAENWHKLAVETTESGEIDQDSLQDAINELIKELDASYSQETNALDALLTTVSNNKDALAALIGTDTNTSVRDITETVIEQNLADTDSALGALATLTNSTSAALNALLGDNKTDTFEARTKAVLTDELKSSSYDSLAALASSAKSSSDALSALLANHTDNQSIEAITNSIFQTVIEETDTTGIIDITEDEALKALVSTVIDNTSAIAALQGSTGGGASAEEIYDIVSNLPLTTFVDDSDEIEVLYDTDGNAKKLGIKELDISKLVQSTSGIQIILSGGSAVATNYN